MLPFPTKPTRRPPDAVAPTVPVVSPPLAGGLWSDGAIDTALCKVPLPDGIISRLNAIVVSLPDVADEPVN